MGDRLILGMVFFLLVESFSFGALYLQGVGTDHSRSFKHDRFYSGADKAFIGAAFDWSGVGQASDGKWVTMISPSCFVSANHYHPAAGSTVVFYQGNDRTRPSHTYTVDSWSYTTRCDGLVSDLWLGRLTTPLLPEDNITTYPILTVSPDDALAGREIYVYGVPNRVGRNVIDAVSTLDLYPPGGDKTRVFSYGFQATGGVGEDEAYLIAGDSGGPSFIVHNNALALVGIHYIDSGWPLPGDPVSEDSLVPFYVDQLNTHMAGESVVVVSESVIRGNLTLADSIADLFWLEVTFEIRDPGSTAVLESHTIYPRTDGSYAFSTPRQGVYDVAVRASHWLRQKKRITIGDNETLADFALTNGDADGDNAITSTDLSIVLAAMNTGYGESSFDERADLNVDWAVNEADLVIVQAGMDMVGDQ